ncbi:hypothetical protein [Escherichia phage A221]|nr:hypothetical protein [Escherichia phage A221]
METQDYKILVTTVGFDGKNQSIAVDTSVLEFKDKSSAEIAFAHLVESQKYMSTFMRVKQTYTKLY